MHTLDRFARNQAVQGQVLEALGRNGVGFATVVEGHDYTTPTGKLIMSVMGAVNEFFSAQTGVHVSKSQRQRAVEGLPVGPIPFGYVSKDPRLAPKLQEAEAPALQEVWRRRAEGESMAELSTWLNARGFRTKEGNLFTSHAIKDIFKNRFYLGVIIYQGEEYPGQHEPLVSPHLFDRVQARRGTAQVPRKVWQDAGVIQGIISCGLCGSPIQSDARVFANQCTGNVMGMSAKPTVIPSWPMPSTSKWARY